MYQDPPCTLKLLIVGVKDILGLDAGLGSASYECSSERETTVLGFRFRIWGAEGLGFRVYLHKKLNIPQVCTVNRL